MNYSTKYGNIPDSMKQRNNWILWSKRQGKNGEFTKVPISPNTLTPCASNDISNFQSFEYVQKQLEINRNQGISGIGFCLDNLEICIDLDHSLDQNKKPFSWASEILKLFPDTYIEISQSGEGLHIFVYGNKLFKECKFGLISGGSVEIYQHNRFIAMTGDLFQDSSIQLIDGSDGIQKLYSMKKDTRIAINKPINKQGSLLEKMFSSKNGHKVKSLFEGDISDYNGDDSRADQALMNHLAFWTGKDSSLMEELFNQSQLGKRDKWIQREDYRTRTIQKALDTSSCMYQENIEIISSSCKAKNEEWEKPKPLTSALLPVIPFAVELFLPESLRDYVSDIADRMQCPVDFPALATIAVLSSAIGSRVGVCPKAYDHDWLEIPNLWGFIVGRPSLMKSPAIKDPISLFNPLIDEAIERYKAEMKKYKANNKSLINQQKAVEEQIKKLSKEEPVDKNKIKELKTIFEIELIEPQEQRFVVNDATVEKLGEILSFNPLGVLLFRDELNGFFKSLEKDNQETSRTFFLEAWKGDSSYTVDRIGRGTIRIDNLCISIFGTIQPDVLQEMVHKNISLNNEFDGFFQRFQLITYPDISENWQNIDRKPNVKAKEFMKKLVRTLTKLNPDNFQGHIHPNKGLSYLRFNNTAQKMFDEWRQELEYKLRNTKEHPVLESHFAKYRGLIPSLALIFHFAEPKNHSLREIDENSLSIALAFSEYLESHTRRIYNLSERVDLELACILLIKFKERRIQSPFALRDIYRKNWKGLKNQAVIQKAINELIDKGILKTDIKNNSSIYLINPNIYEVNDNG